MSKSIPFLFIILFIAFSASAQTSRISGKILNSKNEPLAGVSINISGLSGGTISDMEGRFSISLQPGRSYSLHFSAVGYVGKSVEDILLSAGQEIDLPVVLEMESRALGTVTVTATRSSLKRETVNSAIQFQKNTNTVAAVVSAESIRRSPDKNTSEVLKRVPGTSIQEGKYLIVRGLSDRYNQAMLNGVQLSTTEPDRKTFSFDIFPSSVIDNIVINKAFVPEFPAEWAGGLVQINTKDIPSAGFLNIQVGTGFNSATIGKDFYTYKGGTLDWLGIDDGTRGLPAALPAKNAFSHLTVQQKTAFAKDIATSWSVSNRPVPLNKTLQLNGGFVTKIFNKDFGANLSVTYNQSHRNLRYSNKFFSFDNNISSLLFDYGNNKYSNDILAGALANFSIRLNANNKISFKNILNVNSSDYALLRSGTDYEQNPVLGESVRARELSMRSNTFFNSQLLGEHNMPGTGMKLNWYGSFNILDSYIPQQRRVQYNQSRENANAPFLLLIGESRSQKTGSVFYSTLSDYNYTAGGDLNKNFELFNRKQSVKAGYLFQVKDRLFNARPFSIYLPDGTSSLKMLDEDHVFDSQNFDAADPKKFRFDEIAGKQYRYMANSLLNAGFLQFDNSFSDWLRVVWGVRYENFDQLVGSTQKSDERFAHSQVGDFLPALNLTFKLNPKTNLRFSASKTLVRPEFRELTNFTFYDFELGAGVMGLSSLQRTKISNLDLRYEIYPAAGELFTAGIFFKHFDKPIELYFNQSGVATNTFNYLNIDQARSFGAEIEMRKKLSFLSILKNFTFQANLSYIYNRVKSDDKNLVIDRPMQGQSPYVINAALLYDLEQSGLSATLLFNQIGRRILYVGNDVTPEIWEAPRPLLDFQLSKKILKRKGELRLNISDIFNNTAYFYHDLDKNRQYKNGSPDALALTRKYGTQFSFTFGYTIK